MQRLFFFATYLLCLAVPGTAEQAASTILPAGTLLRCTIDEPNFSSQTAQVSDPLLCHVSSLGMFGRPVFPRGAYLSGRMEDFRDPGHFFGKGWLKLEFTSLILPGGSFPLNAKVVSTPRYKVDREGKIRGRGHPRRDAVEWAIPILWPIDVITLPMRGPRPALKGETRILLRLLEDVNIPEEATSSASLPMPEPPRTSSNTRGGRRPGLWYGGVRYDGVSVPAAQAERPSTAFQTAILRAELSAPASQAEGPRDSSQLRLLIFKDGTGHVVTDYWIEGVQLFFRGTNGTPGTLPLNELDLQRTVQLNAERGVPFVLTGKSR